LFAFFYWIYIAKYFFYDEINNNQKYFQSNVIVQTRKCKFVSKKLIKIKKLILDPSFLVKLLDIKINKIVDFKELFYLILRALF